MKTLFLLFFLHSTFAATDERAAFKEISTTNYIIYSFTCLFLVMLGGLMSGMTVGLMGIDEITLELKIATGTAQEKKDAHRVLTVINQHHLLLVTLLLANAFAMEGLPLCLDTMFNSEISVLLSVTCILFFGEIIPQSFCTGANQLKIACRCIPIIKFFMIILFPLAYPLAKLLDKVLGEKESKKKLGDDELRTFIGIQKFEESNSQGLDVFQIKMMTGMMDLSKLKISAVQIPLTQLAMIEKSDVISQEFMRKLINCDCPFVTIFSQHKHNICGTFNIKKIVAALKERNFQVSTFQLDEYSVISGDRDCLDCLKTMGISMNELYFVTDRDGVVTGVIRKEDIMGRIMQSQNLNEKAGINEISNALIGVLEGRDKPTSSTKTETVKRTKRVVSR